MKNHADLGDLNPVPEHHGDRWVRSPEGERTHDQVLARTEAAVGAEQPRPSGRRLVRYLIPAAALGLIAATVVLVSDDGRAPTAPSDCPVTIAVPPYLVPPEPWPAAPPPRVPMHAGHWYGTEDLWTIIPFDGARFAPPGTKLFYWSRHFMTASDDFLDPELTVRAERLDREANDVVVDHANNGGRADVGTFMVTGMELPTAGCWEITAEYRGAKLSYVVWVAED
jgi:hypothetical protein